MTERLASPRTEFARYALSTGLVVLAVLVERLVQWPAGMQFPGLVYASIVAVAWYGGGGPTVFTIAVGVLASWAMLANADGIPDRRSYEVVLVFAVVAAGTAAVAIALRRARDSARTWRARVRAAERAADELRETVSALAARLDGQAEWHAMTLASIGDAVVTIDAHARVKSMNAAAEAWTGREARNVRGQPLADVVDLVDATGTDVTTSLEGELQAGRAVQRDDELALRHRDGRQRCVSITAVPLMDRDGRQPGALVTLRDETRPRDAANAQRRLLDTARTAERTARDARAAMEAAHEKFAAFMTNFPYPAFIQDETGAFVFVNRAAGADAAWQEAAGARHGTETHAATVAVKGTDRHYFSIRFPIAVEGRMWLGGIAIDVSERVRAQHALSERTADFETLFRNVPAPLWMARGAAGDQVVGNPAARRLLGLPSDDRAAAPVEETSHFERDGERLETHAAPLHIALREGRVVPYTDLEVVRADGTRSHISATAAPLLDAKGQVRGAVAAALDISQLKAYESELEHAVRRRDEFLAVLAHELRNPLAPIRNAVQILQKVPEDLERVRRNAVTIDRQTSLLVRLIDDLLDVARISQGVVELDIAPHAVGAIVTAALETILPEAERTGHAVSVEHVDAGATMMVDALRAEQVLANLLSNAVKYTPPGSRVHVRSHVANGFVSVDVSDEGPGIPAASLPQLFTMFSRTVQRPRARVGGLGVGLALARQLAEQQGGGIRVANRAEGGATFTVWFPQVLAAAAAD